MEFFCDLFGIILPPVSNIYFIKEDKQKETEILDVSHLPVDKKVHPVISPPDISPLPPTCKHPVIGPSTCGQKSTSGYNVDILNSASGILQC